MEWTNLWVAVSPGLVGPLPPPSCVGRYGQIRVAGVDSHESLGRCLPRLGRPFAFALVCGPIWPNSGRRCGSSRSPGLLGIRVLDPHDPSVNDPSRSLSRSRLRDLFAIPSRSLSRSLSRTFAVSLAISTRRGLVQTKPNQTKPNQTGLVQEFDTWFGLVWFGLNCGQTGLNRFDRFGHRVCLRHL